MPLSPKRVIHRKVQRGREKGNATRDNYIDFGDIALVAMEPTWLDARVIEAARVAINRKLDRKGNVWIRVFPDKPITKKPAEVRMGKGKGAPDHWAAVIKPGTILFEVGGVDIELAHRALELAADKLPVIAKIVVKPTRD
ncbi:50S ribosomal protein L16 [Treponema sp. Marseille-Q3903]|uniref:50S ribosomal protein L16 n=1 Tax=Treponema sp. Marseille-Q3903 TaxID=2766703 RepID=UPI00165298DE|nr:50S ribosomal protein L16 [Treponema sp. Marseille-Q3903]MBC6712839.1 50S ribosomal protein L16 [Treponema sp. Marseille-Q3903]